MPSPVDLDDIAAGMGGFKLVGETVFDRAGAVVSGAGDVNGDGFADLLVGAPTGDPYGYGSPGAYVVFGKAGGFATTNLGEVAAGVGGFKIVAFFPGRPVSGAGDVNGDGFDDVLGGADDANAAYVAFGKASGFATVNFGEIIGENVGDYAGRSVSGAGDVNGDGFADVIVGAPSNGAGGFYSGAAYVVFGKAGGFATVNLDEVAAGAGGFKIIGEADWDRAGSSVSGAGDVNGDGFADLLVGADYNDAGGYDAGAAYVVFGKADGFATVNLDEVAAGISGFKIVGEDVGDVAGDAVSGAGDVNGDGFDDLLIGAGRNDAGGTDAGAAYVVFGKAGGSTVNLDDVAAGTGGFKIVGEAADDFAGESVSRAGDVNGDGFADLLIGAGANDAGGTFAGAAYLVFGKAGGFVTVHLDDVAAGIGGFKIIGEAEHNLAGSSVSGAGDVNGDGFADLLVGAPGNVTGGERVGAAYVVFGWAAPREIVGTEGGDTLSGTGGDDRIEGGPGRDRLFGAGGNDLLAGGPDADTLNGGAGDDTADYTGTGYGVAVRLAAGAAAGEGSDRLVSIETVLGGSGDDRIIGNAVANLLVGLVGDDFLEGGRNNDTLRGGVGDDTLQGARDHDLLEGGTGRDLLRGDSGNDTLLGRGDDDRLIGGAGNDVLEGGPGRNLLYGDSGNDTLRGGDDDDRLAGGAGGDRLEGGAGVNELWGESGNDELIGGWGEDKLYGGDGADTLTGGLENDRLVGGAGNDRLDGVEGADELWGNSGNDTLLGGVDGDRLVGGAGDDRLEGGGGADELRGESGNDELIGGQTGDRLYGGYGADTLTGDAGADRFFFTAVGESGTNAATRDVITALTWNDLIDLSRIDAVQGGGDDAFAFIGTDAFTAAGQVRFARTDGSTLVEGNVDGDLAADFQIELLGLHDLTADQFVL